MSNPFDQFDPPKGNEFDRFDARKLPGEETARDIAGKVNTGVNWLGTQFTKGVTGLVGAPAVLGELGQKGAEWVGGKLGAPEVGQRVGREFKRNVTFGGVMQSPETLNQAVFGRLGVPEVNAADVPALTLTNPLGIPGKVNFGKMLDAGAQAIPGAMMLPAGAAAATLSPGARAAATAVPAFTGGAVSEAAGQATEGTPYEIPARIAGGTVGYMAGGRLVSPLPANLTPEQQRLVELSRDKGIPMTVGQETGRGRGIESALGRFPTSQGRMADFADNQQQAINRDLFSQIGQTADRSDPTTMNRVIAKASGDFNAAKNTSRPITLDRPFYRELADTVQTYLRNTPESGRVPIVKQVAEDMVQASQTQGGFPNLTGTQYQELRKVINDAVDTTRRSGDGGAMKALQGLRRALDDAMERSLPADEAAAWRRARFNWAGLKTLTKASAGGSLDSRSSGNFTPASLSTALRGSQGADQFSSRVGGMNDTARVAGYLADTRPNSGTPQTLMMQGMMTGGPIAAGYAAGGLPGAGYAAAGMFAPNVLARMMTGSGFPGAGTLRSYLANQAMPTAGTMPALQSLADVPYLLAPGIAVSAPRLPAENRR